VFAICFNSCASAIKCGNWFCIAVTWSVALIAVRRDLTAGSIIVVGSVRLVFLVVFIRRFFIVFIVYSVCYKCRV